MMTRLFPVLLLAVPALAAPKVAVITETNPETSAADVATQINDQTWLALDAVAVPWTSVTSAADLAGYDVVVVGSSGFGGDEDIYDATLMAAVAGFHANGGGVVASSWMSYEDPGGTVAPIVPIVQASRTRGYCTGASSQITRVLEHPVVDGLTSWTADAAYAETPGPLVEGAVPLANCTNGAAAVIVREAAAGRGRQVYLGQLFFGATSQYNNTALRAGSADRLLEQAVAWASGACEDADEDGVSSCAGDCDDEDPARYPGNPEICDGVDNDCDEQIPADEADDDDDGARVCEGDCDDDEPASFPGNPEVCDGLDNDCANGPDDGLTFFDVWPDADGDGYGDDAAAPTSVCALGDEEVDVDGDCDDADAAISPDAEEIPGDGIDNDCDGEDAPKGCGCATAPGVGWWALAALIPLVARRPR